MKKVIIEMDGDSYCARREDFVDLQTSNVGYGMSDLEALEDLIKAENKKTDSIGVYKGSKKRFTLGRNILLSSGTIMFQAPVNLTLIAPHYEITIGIGDDHFAKFLISEEAAKALFGIKKDTVIF